MYAKFFQKNNNSKAEFRDICGNIMAGEPGISVVAKRPYRKYDASESS